MSTCILNNTAANVKPEHLADLRRSGLDDATIITHGFYSATREDARRMLGFDPGSDCLAFPFPSLNDAKPFVRFKPDLPLTFPDERTAKYLSPKGADNRLYVPHSTQRVLQRADVPLIVTEGEKKALKAAQEGFPCVGLTGVDDFVQKPRDAAGNKVKDADSEPIADLDLVQWRGRVVFICYDSDIMHKPEVKRACWRLRCELTRRGATVRVVYLPDGEDGAKTGLDDYLVAHGADALQKLLDAAPLLDFSLRAREVIDAPDDDARDNFIHDLIRDLARDVDPLTTERVRSKLVDAKLLSARTFDAMLAQYGTRHADADVRDGQGREVNLRDPEPWGVPVNGADVLDELCSAFLRHLALPSGAAETLSLWVFSTYAFDAAQIAPVLALTSPLPRCGKTVCLTLLSALTPRALFTSNVTAAALFRLIERYQPTLLIDEADTFLPEREELRGILNSGHWRMAAVVIRTAGEEHEPRTFSTWCPKAIALIGKLPATLADRSIEVKMRRRAPTERVKPLRLDRLDDFLPLCQQASRWALDNLEALRRADPPIPAGLHDRAADCWRPLLAIADLAGGGWAERAREAAVILSSGEGDDVHARVQLLAHIRGVFTQKSIDKLPSAELVEALNDIDEMPLDAINHGKPLTPNRLARLLKPFGISPRTIRVGEATPKGYDLSDFQDSFNRYIPPSQSATSATCPYLQAKTDISKRNINANVALCEEAKNAVNTSNVADVAVCVEGIDEGVIA